METENDEEKRANLFGEPEHVWKDFAKGKLYNEKLVAEKFRKAKMDNDLRAGLMVYKSEAVQATREIVNLMFSALNVLLAETLPYEQIKCKTLGEFHDLNVATYNKIVEKAAQALEGYLAKPAKLEEPPQEEGETDD